MKNFSPYQLLLMALFFLLAAVPTPVLADDPEPVLVLTIDGPITPAQTDYLLRGIQTAESRTAPAIILELNTPGGNVSTMQEMVSLIRGSSIPVIVYVSPSGAVAGSAGTVITLAGHLSAMAPDTAIGAASPVGPGGQELMPTSRQKVEEIITAQIRSLAENRGAEAVAFAEKTVTSAAAASGQEALEVGLVDYRAENLDDLLLQLDGASLFIQGEERILATAGAETERLPLTVIEQVLQLLTDPNIVFLLLVLGVQAVLIEISNPGGWVPGFLGVVCLALAGYGLGILPVNWFGLIFIITAVVLFILEIKAPTKGALTAAGVGSLITGALVLFNSPGTPEFQRVSIWLVVVTSLISGGVIGGAMYLSIRSQQEPIRTGKESLLGRIGYARTPIRKNQPGQVQVGGELWQAVLQEGAQDIQTGDQIEVTSVIGLRLGVKGTDGEP